MKRKKIIRSVTVPQSLGFCKEVMLRMEKVGYESVVVTSPGEALDKFRVECPQFKTIEVPMERHIALLKDVWALLTMIGVMLRERPYMVHSMTPKAGLLSMVAAWLTGVPVRIHTFTGLIWPTAVGFRRKILMLMDRLLCACATHVIPEGQGVLNDLRDFGVCRKPMKVLGYGNARGVDMERFNPARFASAPMEHRPFTFVFVGRMVGDKGINELVEAFTRLNDKYSKTRLLLVGPYEKHLDPVSELTQNRIDASKAIVACGPKYGDELLQMYVDADCFVMPSYREGFPNTVLEAGAMGLPQIVTDINGSREIIINGENGLIVPPKDAGALYGAMERMLTDEPMRKSMAEKARELIANRFEKGFVQQCLMDFYEEVAFPHRSPKGKGAGSGGC